MAALSHPPGPHSPARSGVWIKLTDYTPDSYAHTKFPALRGTVYLIATFRHVQTRFSM